MLQGGAVLLDGIDVRELQQGSLRGAVAVVPQVQRALLHKQAAAPHNVYKHACGSMEGSWVMCLHAPCTSSVFLVQDTVLFADTVRRNIRYGRPGASDEEIDRAAGQTA